MISNPATFFINNSETREFTYEGGTKLFHWSPNASSMSRSMESNVIFFANDIGHARDVLRRLFEFWIDCNERYAESQKNGDSHGSTRAHINQTKTLRQYLASIDEMIISDAPTNQFYEVGWACNDNLHV